MSDPTFGTHMAFMAHIPHSEIDYVVSTLTKYDSVGEYLIGLESGNFEHMHFFVEMSRADYGRFRKRVFIDRFKLRGRARKGLARQYGKVKKIDNLTKMAAYTLKDGNIRTNMPEAVIKAYQEESFQKKEEQTFKDQLVEFVEDDVQKKDVFNHVGVEPDQERFYNLEDLAVSVAQFMRDNGKVLRRSTISNYVFYVMQFSNVNGVRRDTQDMVHHLFGSNLNFRL